MHANRKRDGLRVDIVIFFCLFFLFLFLFFSTCPHKKGRGDSN